MAKTREKGLKIDFRPAIEVLGLKYVLDQVGLDRVVSELGEEEIVKHIGVDRFVAALSPADRRELKRRLQ